MGLGSGIDAGKAFVKFVLEDKELKSGLRSAGKQFQKWGSIGAAATAPIIAGLTACAAAAIKVGGEFTDMSARTGISVQALSELKFAADQTGTSIGSIEKAVRKSQIQIANAAITGGPFLAVLDQLGLSIDDLKNKRPEDQFTVLATAISKIPDQGQRAAMATKVFGKAGAELLPILNSTTGGVEALRAKAHELGVTMTDEDAAAADDLGDALDGAKAQVAAMAVQIGVAIAGPLTEFITWAQTVLTQVIAWIKANPELVRGIAAVTLGVAAASAAAIAFGTILAVISAHPIIAALTAIAALIIGIASYFGLASSGAADFKKELSGIKKPGGATKVDPVAQQQADEVVRRLQGAASGPGQGVGAAAADRGASLAAEGMGEVVKWTRSTSEGVQRLVQLVSRSGGFTAGSG
jgi:TP901 family phage tail tape measure protein